MSRIHSNEQLYEIKGYYQHQNYEDEFSFSGTLLRNADGMFEGIVYEKINDENRTRTCYIVGDLFSEQGISLVKMSNYGPKRKAYYYGFTTNVLDDTYSVYGEWHYQRTSLANNVIEYNPEEGQIKEIDNTEDDICYGGYFHFDMSKKSLSKHGVQNLETNIDKIVDHLEVSLQEKRRNILYSLDKQERRNCFFDSIHNDANRVMAFLKNIEDEMGEHAKVLKPYYVKTRKK